MEPKPPSNFLRGVINTIYDQKRLESAKRDLANERILADLGIAEESGGYTDYESASLGFLSSKDNIN